METHASRVETYLKITGNIILRNLEGTLPWASRHSREVFETLSKNIGREETMLAVKPADLERYLAHQKAVAIWNPQSEMLVAYTRRFPMIPEKIMNKARMWIEELGTVYVHPDDRRMKASEVMIGQMAEDMSLERYSDIPRALVATTKAWQAMKAFKQLGWPTLPFREAPYAAAGTCVCEGKQGNGYDDGIRAGGFENVCFARSDDITIELMPSALIGGIDMKPEEFAAKRGTCHLVTDNLPQLIMANLQLERTYGSIPEFVDILRAAGHYETFGQ